MKKNKLKVLIVLVALTGIASCAKNTILPEEAPVSPTTGSRTQFTLDSIYLYAKQIYLWHDAIPSYTQFNPRSFTTESDDLANYKKELFTLSQLALNPASGNPYEQALFAGTPKYSTIIAGSEKSSASTAAVLDGSVNDYGFQTGTINNEVWVSYVNPGSPAYTAGLTRGCQLTAINGVAATISLVNTAMNGSAISLSVKKPDQSQLDLSLSATAYTSIPVLATKIITRNSVKFGFLAFLSFSRLSNAQAALDKAFSTFSGSGITDLIIDLRYNTGGYVETAEYLANLIVPSSFNGKVIYSEHYNSLMQSGKATLLKNQIYLDQNNQPVTYEGRTATMADVDYTVAGNTYTFSKKGGLETVKNIYFIVSSSTASASELLINSLKPYFATKLIGTKTYGKPVGFFGVSIDNYTVYLSNFQIKNSLGEGGYFEGLNADLAAADDLTHDFGDPDEDSMSKIITPLSNTAITDATATHKQSVTTRNSTGSIQTNALQTVTSTQYSAGLSVTVQTPMMIENRLKIKK